ncbi:MAG: hypothetical protein R3A48_19180 [Polyangiales bacterium]
MGVLLALLAAGCAVPLGAPLRLPPASAPLELRAATYHTHSASLRASLWRSWRVRFGDEPEDLSLREARPTLENAPEATSILHERDRQVTLGWGLVGGGGALTVAGALLLPLTLTDGGRDSAISPVIPAVSSLAGLVLVLVGTMIGGAAEPRVTFAVEAYNRWLWDALHLPRGASAPVAPVAPGTLAPWTER